MTLGHGPRIICPNFVNIHFRSCPHCDSGELYHTTPRDETTQYHHYLAGFVLCRTMPLVVVVTTVRGDEPTCYAVMRLSDHVANFSFDVAGPLASRGFYNRASVERLYVTPPVAFPVNRRLVRAYMSCDLADSTP